MARWPGGPLEPPRPELRLGATFFLASTDRVADTRFPGGTNVSDCEVHVARLCQILLLGAILLVGGTVSRGQGARSPAKEVVALAEESEKGTDVAKQAAALGKRFGSVAAAMRLYNARSRGGIGFGPKGVGIERRFVDVGERGITAALLEKESADLIRAANVNLVMAEVTHRFAPEKPFLGRGKKEWERDLEGMKAGSRELVKAVKAKDVEAVRKAAGRINDACNRCHDGAR